MAASEVSRGQESTSVPTDAHHASMRLVEVIQALSLARDLDTVINIVRKAARDLSGSDGASFVLRDGDQCHYVDEDAIGPLWKGQKFPMSICISGWVMIHGQAAAIADIYQDKRIPHDSYRPTFVKSLVMMPVRPQQPIAAIGIYWATLHEASALEIELLQALANSTAIALENIQLYTELEKRVADRTRQLEDTNLELETFSYSVSHDLQAPLRHITNHTALLAAQNHGTLDDVGRRYLERIQGSATRMGELIDDMLRLARITKAELRAEKVNLSQLMQEIAAKLRDESSGRIAVFNFDPDLTGNADAALIRIALENLLSNAWKFTAKVGKTQIVFSSVLQSDGSTAYFVKDNGAGFDMRYASKLFGPFQRLHAEKDFKGTGIGLATVARVIHRHGGRVWAEAAPGQGATFFFTLGEPVPGP